MTALSSRFLAGAGTGAMALALAMHGAVAAHPAAHVHGHLDMDVAVDARTIRLHLESPLDNFLGFERAPRTDAERERVAGMLASLEAADRLFGPDPRAGCELSTVRVESAVLGLGETGQARDEAGHRQGAHDGHHGHQHDEKHGHDGHGEHADIDVTVVFDCPRADAARFVDVGLFEAFDGLRSITARVVSPQGQFRRELRPRSSRLQWTD